MEPVKSTIAPTDLRKHLFYETSHSPSLADLVGYEKAKEIIDFCFIANPYYPDAGDAARSEGKFPQPDQVVSVQQSDHQPEESGGGAQRQSEQPDHRQRGHRTDRADQHDADRPHRRARPDLRGIHRKAQRSARRRALSPASRRTITSCDLADYLAWVRQRGSESAAGHQSRQSHRPALSAAKR